MKEILVLGLGNPLMGDDGIGCLVAERLLGGVLPETVEVLVGGTDMLRYMDVLEGRRQVVILDAILSPPEEVGEVTVMDEAALSALDPDQGNVHSLSVSASIRLLRVGIPALEGTRFVVCGIGVRCVKVGPGLSGELEAAVDTIVRTVRGLVVG